MPMNKWKIISWMNALLGAVCMAQLLLARSKGATITEQLNIKSYQLEQAKSLGIHKN